MNLFNTFYSLFLVLLFFAYLNVFASSREKANKKACFNAPIYVYDEELKKYYRQDWCKSGKQPVYYDSIPVPAGIETKRSLT